MILFLIKKNLFSYLFWKCLSSVIYLLFLHGFHGKGRLVSNFPYGQNRRGDCNLLLTRAGMGSLGNRDPKDTCS